MHMSSRKIIFYWFVWFLLLFYTSVPILNHPLYPLPHHAAPPFHVNEQTLSFLPSCWGIVIPQYYVPTCLHHRLLLVNNSTIVRQFVAGRLETKWAVRHKITITKPCSPLATQASWCLFDKYLSKRLGNRKQDGRAQLVITKYRQTDELVTAFLQVWILNKTLSLLIL